MGGTFFVWCPQPSVTAGAFAPLCGTEGVSASQWKPKPLGARSPASPFPLQLGLRLRASLCLREGNPGMLAAFPSPRKRGRGGCAPAAPAPLSLLGAPAAGKPRARSDGERPRWRPRSSPSRGCQCLVPAQGCPHAVTSPGGISCSASALAGSRLAFPLGEGAGNLGED